MNAQIIPIQMTVIGLDGSVEYTALGHEFVTPAEIAIDLRPLSHAECAARGIRHSSTDYDYTALSDTDTDAHCRQALRSAAGRLGL